MHTRGASFPSWSAEEAPLPTSAAAMQEHAEIAAEKRSKKQAKKRERAERRAAEYEAHCSHALACFVAAQRTRPPPPPLPVPISNGDEVLWLSVDCIKCWHNCFAPHTLPSDRRELIVTVDVLTCADSIFACLYVYSRCMLLTHAGNASAVYCR